MLLFTLAALVGVCLYAAIYHLWIGVSHPRSMPHLLFALLSAFVSLYVLATLCAYQASTADDLVTMRRWEVIFATVTVGVLPWFVSALTNVHRRKALIGLTALSISIIAANFALPYGIYFTEMPTLRYLTLPWGEQVVDLRSQKWGIWNGVEVAFLLLSLGYAMHACVIQYRYRSRRSALAFVSALGIFFIFALNQFFVNAGYGDFAHTAEIGFVAMALLMSMGLTSEMLSGRAALTASETRLRTLVEQAPYGIQVLASDGRTLSVNRAWQAQWGLKVDALANYNILQDEQLREKGVMPLIERAFLGEVVEVPPIVYNPKNTIEVQAGPERNRWVSSWIYPIKDDAGVVREVIVIQDDVTERRRTETAIRRIAVGVSSRTGVHFFADLVKSLASLVEVDYVFVGLIDDHDSQNVTTEAVCMHGKIVENISYRLDDTPCANVVGKTTCTYRQGVQQLFPHDRLLADMGVEGYIGAPLFDVRGAPIGLIVLLSCQPLKQVEHMREILDIFAARTSAEMQRVRAEKELDHYRAQLEARVHERTAELAAANKELQAFSYSVSHDLRAPLRAIDGFSKALVEDFGETLDPGARNYLARIRSSVSHMSGLIDALLALAQVTRTPLQPDHINLSVLVEQSVLRLREADPKRVVTVTIEPEMKTYADPGLIGIALDNLLGNAWKYTVRAPYPRIEVGTIDRNGETEYYVKDNGVGFDMRYAANLFAPFQRLHGRDFEGLGIGLATVERIVQRHGGWIRAYAEVGVGATIYFMLGKQPKEAKLPNLRLAAGG